MFTSLSLAYPWKLNPLSAMPGLRQWWRSRIAAHRARTERRRSLALLLALRERNPRLFEETRIDPLDLLPPRLATISLFPPVVISKYILGADGSRDHGRRLH
jgi:hypothetical protein